MLEKYRDDRLSVSELINHPWLKEPKNESSLNSDKNSFMPEQLQEMLKFDENKSFRLLTL